MNYQMRLKAQTLLKQLTSSWFQLSYCGLHSSWLLGQQWSQITLFTIHGKRVHYLQCSEESMLSVDTQLVRKDVLHVNYAKLPVQLSQLLLNQNQDQMDQEGLLNMILI